MMTPPPAPTPPPIILCISGLSSTGKTTLSRLIRSLLPTTQILHQDDFYHPDSLIPIRAGLQDWDCPEAFNFARFREALEYVRAHGKVPEGHSITDASPVSAAGAAVGEEVMGRCRGMLREVEAETGREVGVVVVDGILVYHEGSEVEGLVDVKVLLRAPQAVARVRREGREGYVTIEGFWKDPVGYWGDVVWPNYVRTHGGLFEGGDVEGRVKEEVEKERGVRVQEIGWGVEEVLEWVVGLVVEEWRRRHQVSKGSEEEDGKELDGAQDTARK